jgi:hypothetical protein
VRKLLVEGLDPKGDIMDVHVIIVDVAHVFGNV